MSVEELGDNVRAKREGDATVVVAPALHVLVWVGPEEVTEETCVGDVRRSGNGPDLVEVVEVR